MPFVLNKSGLRCFTEVYPQLKKHTRLLKSILKGKQTATFTQRVKCKKSLHSDGINKSMAVFKI